MSYEIHSGRYVISLRCMACGKPTGSHKINLFGEPLVLCHICYTRDDVVVPVVIYCLASLYDKKTIAEAVLCEKHYEARRRNSTGV